VDARLPALGAAHMQLAGAEIDIVPAQGDKLAGAQPMAVGEAAESRQSWARRG